MQDLQEGVRMVVAMPKQFLWAPFEMAIVNIVLALMFMLLSIAVLGITPFISMIPLIAGHAILVSIGVNNPHLTTTLRASRKYPSNLLKGNLSKVSHGVKYIP